MNLGDGLVFELENGKPKLIFTTHGFESKTSNKITKNPSGIRPPKLINASKQFPQEASRERTKRTRAKSLGLSKNTSETTTANVGTHAVLNGPGKTNAKRVNGMQSAKRSHGHKIKPANNPKESLVCLTHDQLQQLLSNIDKIACLEEPENTLSKTQLVTEDPRENGMSRKTHEALISDGNLRKNGSAWEKEKDNRTVLNGTGAGLFSKLGERELEKEVLEARRAQWRRELDEQLVEKQQGRESATLLGGPRPVSSKSTSRDVQVQPQEKLYATTAVMEDMDSQASTFSSQRDLPAAIRSAFVLGEAAPLDEAFSAEKKEQQKRWLQELDKQRQEAQQRRRQEKLHQNQAEDHDHWAMHFDSFQKKLLPQPPVVPYNRGEGDLSSSLSHNRSPSRAMSSVSGRDNQGRSSVDTTTGSNPPKASYLRTMTALLDPAQLEERERKRQKQLEHQQAINTQVEERRRQREKEELERNRQEQEEEKRVAKEREYLQQQYLLDTQRERDKEELLSRRTEKMLLSVQRAQEEAQKDKQLQRIRDLARKGHDVSKLLGSLERRSADSVQTLMSQSPSESLSVALKIEELSPASPRRDTSVQTVDMADGISDGRAHLNYPAPLLDMAVEHSPTPPDQPRRPQKEMQLQQQSSGKENAWNASVEPRDVGESNLQEHSRRNSHRVRPVNGKRPEWNTRQPSRPFVPASERYPAGLRQHRQESRLRRQMELLTLVEKNASTRTQTLLAQEVPPSTCVKEENSDQPQTYSMVVRSVVCSPPIPTCSLNQQKQSLAPHHPYSAKGRSESSCNAPPSTDYVPYVRTDEVYHLDPLAMPQTQEVQRKLQTVVVGSRQGTPVAVRDPLLHPELLKNRERQQAILKGLSALRQGLLQKQRELETGLNPLL